MVRMIISRLRTLSLVGVGALCAGLLFTACAKHADQSTSISSTAGTVQSATTATTSAADAANSGSSANGAASAVFDTPIYPGAALNKDQGATTSLDGRTTLTLQIYETKDDVQRVVEWYKTHLPPSWQSKIIRQQGQTMGTFVDERRHGDVTVLVGDPGEGTTRIQITAKHRK